MKAILLVRVSTNQQDLSQQTEKVRAEALKDGFKPSDIIVLEDKESAVKLSETERNGLNNLKWHIENDEISTVYTYEVSRISRQPAMLYNIRDYLLEHHVQLIIINPYMKMLKDDYTLSETANIFFGIFSSMAENEGFIRKARLSRGRENAKKLGLYAGTPLAVGYAVKDKKVVIDEKGAKLVRRVYAEYINGMSMRIIATELQNEGVYGDASYSTIVTNVYNMLAREYYCGDWQHPAIISRDTFDKARAVAKSKTFYRTGRINDGLFKGLIYDEETGRIFSSNAAAKYYLCKECGHGSMSFKFAHTILWGIVKEWYNVIYIVKKNEIRQEIMDNIRRQENIIRQQENNITKNQDKIDRITEMYIDGKLSKEKTEEKQARTFAELQQYKKLLNEAKLEIVRLNDMLNNECILNPDDATIDEKISIVRTVVERITLRKNSRTRALIRMYNKVTGEQRILDCNMWKCKIIKMTVLLRPTLSAPK